MDIVLTFLVVLISSTLSGMSGGGGGFIMTPYFLLAGLSPQQNIAIGSVIGLGLSGGALRAAKGTQLVRRKLAITLSALTLLATFVSLQLLPNIRSTTFEQPLGIFILLMIPSLFVKKTAFLPGQRSKVMFIIGCTLYTLLWLANGLFSAGFAALLFVPMLFILGLSALEANVTKRISALIQAVTSFVVLAPKGLVVWHFAVPAMLGAYLGGYLGTHIAIRNGEVFARIALAIAMGISGVLLLLTR